MPLLTTAAIAALTPFLIEMAKKGVEKIVDTGSEKITENSVAWLQSLFFKNNEPKNSLQKLVADPSNEINQNAIKTIIDNSIEDNPEYENYLIEILDKLPKYDNTITNSKNVVTGNVNTNGGYFINGDGNQIN